ncbi:MAG: UDP-N-acetylmuramoyl-tripeptide--D-alanyl-D-alanine ligase [Cryomorphaceae bacterium]|jgi:UDP-N-acetylmuramoyl-tripeptide--D-alanyl-D-alanine ligase
MNETAVRELLASVSGTIYQGSEDALIESVSTDTRNIGSGCAFFALKGERFDAHDFLGKAVEGGAEVLVVSRIPEGPDLGNTTVIVVADTLTALQRFAAWYRRSLDIKVIGITGSNGKTSTKDFTESVIGEKFNVSATVGNFNNHIGLPLSILSAEAEHEVCIWEMGMSNPGEIAPLCSIAHPDIGIITNIGTAHIEFMGSVDAIAEEKGELAKCLPDHGTFIVSAACDYIDYFTTRTKAKTLIVGNGRGTVRADNLVMTALGSEFDLIILDQEPIRVNLPVVGRHMVANALLAAGAGYTLGMTAKEIAVGLNKTSLTSGRLRAFESNGVTIFDDTYNANPESVTAAIDTLSELNESGVEVGEKYVVLGHMAELGAHSKAAHEDVGKLAARRGIYTVSVGESAAGITAAVLADGGRAKHFNQRDEAAKWLRSTCTSGDVVLFKGSRSAGMEEIMNQAFSKN